MYVNSSLLWRKTEIVVSRPSERDSTWPYVVTVWRSRAQWRWLFSLCFELLTIYWSVDLTFPDVILPLFTCLFGTETLNTRFPNLEGRNSEISWRPKLLSFFVSCHIVLEKWWGFCLSYSVSGLVTTCTSKDPNFSSFLWPTSSSRLWQWSFSCVPNGRGALFLVKWVAEWFQIQCWMIDLSGISLSSLAISYHVSRSPPPTPRKVTKRAHSRTVD